MLKIKDNINLEVLEQFGFEKINDTWAYIRKIDRVPVYGLYVTKKHKYLQIRCWNRCLIAGKLQTLIYDLIEAGIVEKDKGGE